MLTHLTIKNYALIDHLEMDLSGHLNVLTGETGAGKSIMLGAIGLLLGNRADTKVLWNEAEKCVAEGTFDIKEYALREIFEAEDLDYDDQTVLRREISPGGKSRAFINDTPVTLDIMKRIGSRLMDVHSQHETLDLGNKQFQLRVVDAFAANAKLRTTYAQCWKHYLKAKSEYEQLRDEANVLQQESDFVKFQLDELTQANLEADEQPKLESDLKIMEHAEDIKSKFNLLLQQLDQGDVAANAIITESKSLLNSISNYSESYRKLADRLESLRIELADIVNEVETEEQKIEFDPQRIEEIKDRLSLLYQLQQKHRLGSVAELILLRDNLQEKANKTDNLDDELRKLKAKLDETSKNLVEAGHQLSQSRAKTFNPLCKEMQTLLQELGIPEAKLKVDHQTLEPGPSGIDSIELMFSANKGIEVRPLAQVASGGEFSRVMFCVKYILAERTALPTLILDEIDTGVSGEIAIRLGKMMKTMAQKHQLLAISHLPQIAAKADRHFYAFKESKAKKTISQIRLLNEDERVDEIAKMIGGEKPSPLAKENARELITS
ncbi:MAG: DNA repair protein RecN [Cyclobacteriaceae bacterium]|nr:DNA repair protein RecN [Cyclobacteriaceae bacterium]